MNWKLYLVLVKSSQLLVMEVGVAVTAGVASNGVGVAVSTGVEEVGVAVGEVNHSYVETICPKTADSPA